jgi:hypothetical protein
MHKSRDFVEFSLPAVEMLLPVPIGICRVLFPEGAAARSIVG